MDAYHHSLITKRKLIDDLVVDTTPSLHDFNDPLLVLLERETQGTFEWTQTIVIRNSNHKGH